ncbi:metal ABC transporter solute-binding protein, Zn/Mn family [Gracilibacillus saliphilus]|uniref:metal ABC transporter solute-binding protein, Zn/Mn family n=1 Tax=Gracilibacillus saliphilus TaxID=543890 RepID=UPI0013D42966|nr:zinc ABC transporter substrate-binding protein [Gracilibacillus saliphilus]
MAKKWLLGIVLCLGLLSACATNDASNDSAEIQVVTTIAQIADVVENVGGNLVEVQSLMGPGVDPHLYNAVQGDIETLESAEIIFYNGLHLEGQMDEIFEQMQNQKPTIAVAEQIDSAKLLADPENEQVYDPHVWFDISIWKDVVQVVADELSSLDPDHETHFQDNAQTYLEELTETERYVEEQINEIPERSRVLVTAHDAFHYFGKRYGFDVVGLQGLSTESDYSVHDVNHIVDILIDRDVKGVFVESSVSERSIEAVVEGAKEKGHSVEIGGELFSDAMGEEGTEEGTYIGMVKHNIDTIVDALK